MAGEENSRADSRSIRTIYRMRSARAPARSQACSRGASRLWGLRPGAFAGQPPRDDTEQRADEHGDQILEGDFDFAQTEVDAEQPEQASADHCAEHAETDVRPESETLFTEGHEPSRERAGNRAQQAGNALSLRSERLRPKSHGQTACDRARLWED